MTEDTEEERKAQVPTQLDRLDSVLSDLENSIDTLSTRLQSVLRENNSLPKEEEKVVAQLTQLANHIRDSTQRVSNVVGNISSLLELLEL